jgi:arylsulfatase A-like enzyme
MGFDYFYGFNAGDVSQWEPMLTRNTTPITPFVGHPGWQFHHVVDIVPTLLEITGLPAPVQD